MMRTLNMVTMVLLGAQALAWADLAAAEPATNAPPASAVASTAVPAGTGIDAFRVIFERNIFNPNRFGRTFDREREFTRRDPERRIRRESFALVGTMIYEKGVFAFFDGSSPDFKKVLKTSDTIAGFTVAAVTPNEVVLRSAAEVPASAAANASNSIPSLETNTPPPADPGSTNTDAGATVAAAATPATNQTEITLPVGMQLQRFDEGRWEMTARSSPDGGRSTGSSSSSPSSPSLEGGSDEVLRRLMQQREQENGGGSSAPGTAPSAEPPAVSRPLPTPPPSQGGAEDEVLKRLMQRREQENK